MLSFSMSSPTDDVAVSCVVQGWRKAEIIGNYFLTILGMALAVLGGGLSIKKSFF